MKFNIAVCDDENITLKINCTYINELAKKYRIDACINGFNSGEAVIEYAEKEEIDILFMDIDMKGINGIQTASKVMKKNPRVVTIFITGHREFAYDAFTVEAFSFIVKPIEPERLDRIFKKAILQVNDLNLRKQRTPLIITEENLKKKINQGIILYIERNDTQSMIVTKQSRHFVYETITSLVERLEDNFVRISQGIVVNLSEVDQLQQNQVIMKTGERFNIGRTYSKEFKKRYLENPQI
jgi:two-component system LytT family response regulator